MNRKERTKVALISIFLGILVLLSFYFDNQIIIVFSLIRTNFLNSFSEAISFLGSVFVIFVISSLFFIQEKKRKFILPLWLTLAVSSLLSFILKIAIQRQRPFQIGLVSLVSAIESAYNTWDFSFPSTHAMLVFAALPFISKEYPKFKYVWIVFAVLIVASRVYLGVHFLSDVVLGGIIGYMTGFVILKNWKKY